MDLETREGFNLTGQPVDATNWTCVAMRVNADNREKYFIKHQMSMSTEKIMLAVHAPHFEKSLLREKGAIFKSVDFRPVSKTAFDNYVKYLKTKNSIFFEKARDPFAE